MRLKLAKNYSGDYQGAKPLDVNNVGQGDMCGRSPLLTAFFRPGAEALLRARREEKCRIPGEKLVFRRQEGRINVRLNLCREA